MKTLPLPTDNADIHRYALCAIAHMDPEMIRKAIENKPEDVPKFMSDYIESYVRDFQCLSLLVQQNGVAEVERLLTEFKALSFVEKIQYMGYQIHIVPGVPEREPMNFLLFDGSPVGSSILGGGSCEDDWLNALHRAGLGGSALVASGNFPCCWNIMRTEDLHVTLVQDDDGWSSKVPRFKSYHEELRKLGIRAPLLLAHGGYTHSPSPLEVTVRKFFAQHFPKQR